MFNIRCTFVLSYFRTFVLSKVRKYFRTFVLSYIVSTFDVLSYESTSTRTFVLSYESTFESTKVLPDLKYLRRYDKDTNSTPGRLLQHLADLRPVSDANLLIFSRAAGVFVS